MTCNVYWIRHKDHTDMFSQGYVGVSTEVETRWNNHKRRTQNPHLKHAIQKYGWDNLVKQVILTADEAYCYDVENKLRNADGIGWNLVVGGSKPPSRLGLKCPEHSERLKGRFAGDKNPMYGVRRFGTESFAYKGPVEATNVETGEIRVFIGESELVAAGFQYPNVTKCIQGLRKSHKKHTFKRLAK